MHELDIFNFRSLYHFVHWADAASTTIKLGVPLALNFVKLELVVNDGLDFSVGERSAHFGLQNGAIRVVLYA